MLSLNRHSTEHRIRELPKPDQLFSAQQERAARDLACDTNSADDAAATLPRVTNGLASRQTPYHPIPAPAKKMWASVASMCFGQRRSSNSRRRTSASRSGRPPKRVDRGVVGRYRSSPASAAGKRLTSSKGKPDAPPPAGAIRSPLANQFFGMTPSRWPRQRRRGDLGRSEISRHDDLPMPSVAPNSCGRRAPAAHAPCRSWWQ